MSTTQKQFSFTNENLYDQNIFGRVYPLFIKAKLDDNLEMLYDAVENYYDLTQHFYQSKSAEFLEKIDEIKLPKQSQATNKKELALIVITRKDAKRKLLAIWRDISNELHKTGYFKRTYVVDNNTLALPTR